MKKRLDTKLESIADILLQYKSNNHLGLISGKAGIVLFLFYYALIKDDDKYSRKASELFSEILDSVNEGFVFPTFANGLSGIGFLIEFLELNNFIEADTDSMLSEIDTFLYAFMMQEISEGHYDYLHNAGGAALYFAKRKPSGKTEAYLSDFIDKLYECSVKTEDFLKWSMETETFENKKETVFNLGMSHGMASIAVIACKIYDLGIHTDKTKEIIKGSIHYILSARQNTKIYKSIFPNWVNTRNTPYNSRLAWCYGDLGISSALWTAGQTLQRDEWKENAVEIFDFNSSRKDLTDNIILDAGLCHGSSGIAHIYNRIYRNTNIHKFKETADYWFDITLQSDTYKDGLSGYKKFRTQEKGGMQNDSGFLEGISGIGLALLSKQAGIEPKWDEILLLS